MDTIYVLDASGYLYRSYFAIKGMTNNKGDSTNAIYGFVQSVHKLLKDFHPTHLVAVFDGPRNAIKRLQIYPDYKSHRERMPPDLRYQIDWGREFCDLMGIPMLNIPESEADDVMGSVAQWASKQGSKVYLCTTDKDMAQIVSDSIYMLNTYKDNLILDTQKVTEIFGVPPEKMIDYLAITGDTSDNIPGLPGFGPKTAASLLQEHGSLDHILNNPEVIEGKKKQEIIRDNAEKARISRRLVTLDTQVDIPKQVSFYQLKEKDRERLRQFYSNLNFLIRIRDLGDEEEEKEQLSYHCIEEIEDLMDLVKKLKQAKEICFDTETTATSPLDAELVGVGFCIQPKEAWYIPMNAKIPKKTILELLIPLFEDPNLSFYGQNVKYDYHILMNEGIAIANIGFDTMVASYLLHSHQRRHSLDLLALENFGKVKIDINDLIGKGKKAITMKEVPIEKVTEYCCEDVDYTCRLKQLFGKKLVERRMEELYHKIELPLIKVLAKMERNGIFVDTLVLEKYSLEIGNRVEVLVEEIQEMAGEKFNLKSPKQLSDILFKKMGIRPPRKTATGHSTNADVLEFLKDQYPIAGKILEFRTVEKLRSTYLEALPAYINRKTDRIHCSFNQTVAATGRLSCQDPNLQNIPVRTPEGRRIREAFRSQHKGWSLLSADYSQIELRLLAHLSEDPTLIEAFEEGHDIHAYTASKIFGIPVQDVPKELRYQAKTVNFGIIYGQQAFGLSQELGIPVKEAADFIETYFARYKKVKDYIEFIKEQARKTGKAVTMFGRERLIPEVSSKNMTIRQTAERLAVNTPIQGTAADLIKLAMLSVDEALVKEKRESMMILQIHDELLFEVPDGEIEGFAPTVKKCMESVISLKVPLCVDIAVGKNWKEC